MLQPKLNKSWRQHPTRHQLYGHLPPITKTIQVRRTKHAGHCWRSRDELISDVLLWTPTYGRAKAGRPAWTYIQQLCEDTGCSLEDLPEAMNNREKWWERVRDIRASGTTWWWTERLPKIESNILESWNWKFSKNQVSSLEMPFYQNLLNNYSTNTNSKSNWFIDFNGLLIRLGLCYKRLRNRNHCTYLHIWCSC